MNTYTFYTSDGSETDLSVCTYIRIKLVGKNTGNTDTYALISKEDFTMISNYKWLLGKDGYAVTYQSIDKKENFGRTGWKMHSMIKRPFKGYVVDHINRNKLDNRRDNLRICTQKQNNYNKSKPSNSKYKYKGVASYKVDGIVKWKAIVTKDGKRSIIDNLPDEKTAARVHDMMAEEIFGKYAGKNFLDKY